MRLFPNNPLKLVHLEGTFKCGSEHSCKKDHVTELVKYLRKCSTTKIVLNIGYDPDFNLDMDIDDDEDFSDYVAPEGVEVHLCGKINNKKVYARHSDEHHSICAWPMGIRNVENHMFSKFPDCIRKTQESFHKSAPYYMNQVI